MQTQAVRRHGDTIPVFILLAFIACIVLSGSMPPAFQLLTLTVAAASGLIVPMVYRIAFGGDLSLFLIAPTVMSATQNVYLLPIAKEIEGAQVQALVVINFVYAATAVVLLLMIRPKETGEVPLPPRSELVAPIGWMALLLTIYSGVSAVAFESDPTSAFASYRNLVTPFLFTLLGLTAGRTTMLRRYLRHLVILGWVVFAFGLFERFTPEFWQHTNLAELWAKKDLPIDGYLHLPPNYFSSETWHGQQMRRMVGPFADPVNLGTFMFSVLAAAWFLRMRLSALVSLGGIALAISKGALLGILIFTATFTRYRRSRFEFVVAAAVALTVGAYFYLFTLTNSTGSTTAHIAGLTTAFTELPGAPLGHGLGNSGVLAGLFSEGAESASGAVESGIGMVVSQLGLVGIVIYFLFFREVLRATLQVSGMRERILAVSLLLAFGANAAFNEVALSPNSAAPYFVIVGLVIAGGTRRTERDADAEPTEGERVAT